MPEDLKDWQLGYNLDLLKAHAAIFKAAHKEHIYGAFGLVKERDIATALSEERFRVLGAEAALIFRRLKSASSHESYTGRKVELLAGEALISSFAALERESGEALLRATIKELISAETKSESLFASAEPSAIWIEIFEEDALAKKIVLKLGFKYVDTKVPAGSEIKGLYVKGREVPPANDPAEFATLKILEPHFVSPDVRADILAELAEYGEWAQHYSSYNQRGTWTAFALRGYIANDPGFIIRPDEMSRKWREENGALMGNECENTTAAPKFPATMRLAALVPGLKDRVRFMKLAPSGGELTRHADLLPDAGVANGRLARIHIPIVTNPQCVFTQWNSRGEEVQKHFPQGAMCYLDQRQSHAAVNGGLTDRIHLVMDVFSSSELRSLIVNGK